MIINSSNFNSTGQVVTNDLTDQNIEYRGISIVETSDAAPAQVRVYSGTDNTGRLLEVVNLSPSESARELYTHGVEADGIYVEVVSGTVEGSLRWAE